MAQSPDEQSRLVYRPPINFVIYAALMPTIFYVWYTPAWPLVIGLWLLAAYFTHTVVLALHEAAHYHLHPSKWINEARGIAIGIGTLTPLSVYRQLHLYHHSALSTIKDKELWPYNDTRVSRFWRFVSAWGELCCGFVVTPMLYLFGFFQLEDVPRHVRRRAYAECLLTLAFWITSLSAIHYFGLWVEFTVVFLIPSILAGNLQSLRKFTEHMGLLANGPVSASRTVLHTGLVGTFITRSMLNISHHGTHHRFGKIPYHELPAATPRALDPAHEQGPVFHSYWSAFRDMFPTLANPRVGAQWLKLPQAAQAGDTLESVTP